MPKNIFCYVDEKKNKKKTEIYKRGGGLASGEGVVEPSFVANVMSYLVTFIRILQNLYLVRLDCF